MTFFLAGEFREARSGVQAEAVAIETFGFEAARLPPALGSELIAQTSAYVQTVIDDEWPLMPKPRLESREAADALERVHDVSRPAGHRGSERPSLRARPRGLDRVLLARESRLGAGRGSMSGALWFAVLATATITGVLALLYRAETQRWRKWLQVLATLPSGGADSGP